MTGNGLCPHDNEKLSGYIDGVLTQGDAQRVRLHLDHLRERYASPLAGRQRDAQPRHSIRTGSVA